jgi:hypothetical protein
MRLDTKTDWLTDRQSQCDFVVESFDSCSYEKWKAGSWGRGKFGNPEEGERPPLEAAAKQHLVKTEKTLCML